MTFQSLIRGDSGARTPSLIMMVLSQVRRTQRSNAGRWCGHCGGIGVACDWLSCQEISRRPAAVGPAEWDGRVGLQVIGE